MTSAREGIIALAEALEELTKADEKEQAEGHQRWWKPLENMLRGYKSKHEAMAHRANGKYDALISMVDGLSAYGLLAEDFQVGIFVCSFYFADGQSIKSLNIIKISKYLSTPIFATKA